MSADHGHNRRLQECRPCPESPGRASLAACLVALASAANAAGPEGAALPKGDCATPLPAHDLSHCNFAALNRPGLDLRGTNLDGVIFENANLANCDLRGARLRQANLKWANLSGCDLSGADLGRAELFHTNFVTARLEGANLARANLFGAYLDGIKGSGADFSDAYLKDISIEDGDLRGSRLDRAYMFRAVLINSRLNGASVHQAVLTGAALEGVDLSDADLGGSLLNGAVLAGTRWNGARLTDARFVNADVDRADFTGAREMPEHLSEMLKAAEPVRRRSSLERGKPEGHRHQTLGSAHQHPRLPVHPVAHTDRQHRLSDVPTLALGGEARPVVAHVHVDPGEVHLDSERAHSSDTHIDGKRLEQGYGPGLQSEADRRPIRQRPGAGPLSQVAAGIQRRGRDDRRIQQRPGDIEGTRGHRGEHTGCREPNPGAS
jgi:uncharacterized protein YjbI with pentapeptide repeats